MSEQQPPAPPPEGQGQAPAAAAPEQAAAPSKPPENGTAPLLEARNVSKYFGSVIALEDITFKVNAGEVACVLGDNGAGKSTLIKMLSGVHAPDQGELLIEGEPVRFSGP